MLRGTTIRRRPNSTPSAILNLHTDVIHRILDLLPTSSIVALALSCRQVYFLIGTVRSTDAINRSLQSSACRVPVSDTLSDSIDPFNFDKDEPWYQERQAFLILLQRDSKTGLFCASCQALHDTKSTKYRKSSRGLGHPCFAKQYCHDWAEWFPRNLSFVEFNMAVRRHRAGLSTKSMLRAFRSYHEYGPPNQSSTDIKGHTRSQSVRISAAGIYIREHLTITLTRAKNAAIVWPQRPYFLEVCNHQRITNNSRLSRHAQREVASYTEDDSWSTSPQGIYTTDEPDLIQCDKCFTEMRVCVSVDVKRSDIWEIGITSWKWFGACESVFGGEWKSHVGAGSVWSGDSAKEVRFLAGSVREGFEMCEKPAVDLLVCVRRRFAKLVTGDYRRVDVSL